MIICPKCKGRVEVVDAVKSDAPMGRGTMFIPLYRCTKCKKEFTDKDAHNRKIEE